MAIKGNTSNVIPPLAGSYNLQNYGAIRETFSWENAAKELSFWKIGKVNAAYETIDRHVDEGYREKIALHYVNGSKRRTLTFQEVKEKIDDYARVLKSNGVKKRGPGICLFTENPRKLHIHFGCYKNWCNCCSAI